MVTKNKERTGTGTGSSEHRTSESTSKKNRKQNKNKKKEKTKKKAAAAAAATAAAEHDSPIDQRMGKVYKTIIDSSQEMVFLMTEHNMINRGSFFPDLQLASKALDYAQNNNNGSALESLKKALEQGQEGFQKSYDEMAKISDNWVAFTRKHSCLCMHIDKNTNTNTNTNTITNTSCRPTPTTRVDDPKNWSQVEVITTLNYHGFRLDPFPNRRVLNQIVRQLIKFRLACGVVVENAPTKEQTRAISALAYGENDEDQRNRKTADYYFARNTVSEFMAEAQFSSNFRLDLDLDLVPTWEYSVNNSNTVEMEMKHIFSNARQQHGRQPQFYQETFHRVLQCVDTIAEMWDRLEKGKGMGKNRNPGKDIDIDIVAKFSANEGTLDSKNLAIRPVQLWKFTPPGDDGVPAPAPVPVLGVEYMQTSQRTAGPDDLLRFSQGFRAETLLERSSCSDKAMDMFVSLLDENRSRLAISQEDKDTTNLKYYTKKAPKGWKFSILRPVDPTKPSGLKMCPNCDKPATRTCSQCKIVGYCSRDCQKAQWKEHKKICIPASSRASGSRCSDNNRYPLHTSGGKSDLDEATGSSSPISRNGSKGQAHLIAGSSAEGETQDKSRLSPLREDSLKPSHVPSRLSQRERVKDKSKTKTVQKEKVQKMKHASTRGKNKKMADDSPKPKPNPLPENLMEVGKVLKEFDEKKKSTAREELKALLASINDRNHSQMDADGPHREIILSISNNEVSTKLSGWSDEDVAAFEEFKRERRSAEAHQEDRKETLERRSAEAHQEDRKETLDASNSRLKSNLT